MPQSMEMYGLIYLPSDLQRHGAGLIEISELRRKAEHFMRCTNWGKDYVQVHRVTLEIARGNEPAGPQLEIQIIVDRASWSDTSERAEVIRAQITRDFLDAQFGIKVESPPEFTNLTRVARPIFA